MTTFTRNASGDLITITSQDGQDTTVMLDANGYLAALTNPELETTSFFYTDDGSYHPTLRKVAYVEKRIIFGRIIKRNLLLIANWPRRANADYMPTNKAN